MASARGLTVQKFGGTSVGTPERIRAVADRIARARAGGRELVVVVSAMGHATDELIELAHQVSPQPPHREMDMLLTAGERISMALLSMALQDRKVPAVSFTGSQSGIITDGSHRRARIKRILGDRVREAVSVGQVAIVAGFQGVSEQREITTLGRGGSDTTAVALAAALKAEVCEIFTDVDGVYRADPRVVPRARFLRRIPADLMIEMASRGAGVLHPRCVELARQFRVDLTVRNSFNENEGTVVTSENAAAPEKAAPGKAAPEMSAPEKSVMEEFGVTGVTADASKILVTVELARPTVLGALWQSSAEANLPVCSPVFSGGKVEFFTDTDSEAEWNKRLSQLSVEGFVRSYEVDAKTIPLSVVGYRFMQDGAALQRVIDLLATERISVTIGSASALALTVAVPRDRADDGVRLLYKEFLERGGTT